MTKKPESITCGIFYCQDSGCFSVSASNVIGNLESPNFRN